MAAKIENQTYSIVEEMIPNVLKAVGGCDCEQCRLDVLALSMNALPPKYTVSEVGSAIARSVYLTPEVRANVVSAIATALILVNENPRH